MNAHDPLHRQTWDLIPWLVNDTLDDAQRQTVDAHLRECADCREELAFQRKLHAGMVEDAAPTGTAPAASLARLFERIDAEDEAIPQDRPFDPLEAALPPPTPVRRFDQRRVRLVGWLAAAAIVEAIGLVGLGAMLAEQREPAAAESPYMTLSQGVQPVAGASIRLVPSPTLRVGDLQALLSEAGLHIVDSNAGGTILALGFERSAPPAAETGPDAQRRRVEDALQRLRAKRGVLLAEPIHSATAIAR
jgi:anti-sigma factor RsiW